MKIVKTSLVYFITLISVLLLLGILFAACSNGSEFSEPLAPPVNEGGSNLEDENIKLPDFDNTLDPGTKVFSIALTKPSSQILAEGYQTIDFNAALIGELFVTDKAPAEKLTFTLNLTLNNIADDLIKPAEGENPQKTESGAIRITAKYEKEKGADDFAEILVDGKTAKKTDGAAAIFEIKKERAGTEIPVTLILDNTKENQQGIVTLSLTYASGIYDVNKNFDEIKLLVYSVAPASGDSGKPEYRLASLIQGSADIELKAEKTGYKAILGDSTSESSQNSFSADFTARFLNVAADKPLVMSVVSATAGVAVSEIQKTTRSGEPVLYGFSLIYKNQAQAFAYNTDIVVVRFEPAPDSVDYYGGQPVEITIEAVRKPSFRFSKPEFTVSKAADALVDETGFYTILNLPQIPDTASYKIWRQDDSSAEFKLLTTVGGTGAAYVYKDYNALVYKTETQKYKIQLELDAEKSLESAVIEGSRQLTNKEFLIAVSEALRYVFMDASPKGIHTADSSATVSDSKGGSAKHSVTYQGAIGYSHEYVFNQYQQNFVTIGQNSGEKLTYNKSGGAWDDIANNSSSGITSVKAPLEGKLHIVSPLGNGAITLTGIKIDSNDRNKPLWSAGNITVEYNGKTRIYTKDDWVIPFYMTAAAFNAEIKTADYTQTEGGKEAVGGTIFPYIENASVKNGTEQAASCQYLAAGTSAYFIFNDPSYATAEISFDLKLIGLTSGQTVTVTSENGDTALVSSVTPSSAAITEASPSATITLKVDTGVGKKSGKIALKLAYQGDVSAGNVTEILVTVEVAQSSFLEMVKNKTYVIRDGDTLYEYEVKDNGITIVYKEKKYPSTDFNSVTYTFASSSSDTVAAYSAGTNNLTFTTDAAGSILTPEGKPAGQLGYTDPGYVPPIVFPGKFAGKSFARRMGLALYEYEFSSDGKKVTYKETVWRNGTVETGVYNFTSETDSAAAYDGKNLRLAEHDTMLYSGTDYLGHISFADPEPTFKERVAGKTFKNEEGTYSYTFAEDGNSIDWWQKKWWGTQTAKYTFDKQRDNVTSGYKESSSAFYGLYLINNDTEIQRSATSHTSTDAILTAPVWERTARVVGGDYNPSEGTITEPPFITSVKGKTFVRREGLVRYDYKFSTIGDIMEYTKSTWQPGPTADYPVEKLTYTLKDRDNDITDAASAAYTQGTDSSRTTVFVSETKLSLEGTQVGDSTFNDKGPTFKERVAGRSYSGSGYTYNFDQNGNITGSVKYTFQSQKNDNGNSNLGAVYNKGISYWGCVLSEDSLTLYWNPTSWSGVSTTPVNKDTTTKSSPATFKP